MKIGNIEVNAATVDTDATDDLAARVRLTLVASPWFSKHVDVAPATARELAAELLQAANLAEGKS